MSALIPVWDDPRGTLLPLDLAALPFTAVRLFVVTAPPGGATRGGHAVPCRELLVLVRGRAVVRYGETTSVLDAPGAVLLLEPGPLLDYDLSGDASLLVLADQPFAERP